MSNRATVPMKRADGVHDSLVHFPDASTVKPDDDGVVAVPGQYVTSMFAAGYVIVAAANTTHIP